MLIYNGLRYRQFRYKVVDWETYKTVTELTYPDLESLNIEIKCFQKNKEQIKKENLKEFHPLCYSEKKGNKEFLHYITGDLDYDYYEHRKDAAVGLQS